MATTTPAAGGLTVTLEQIHVPDNVRPLNSEHVRGLAASIALQRILVPIVICPAESALAAAGFEYELVSGFHRVAAARELALTEVPAVVRDSAGEQADRAVENIVSCRHRHETINADRVGMLTNSHEPVVARGAQARRRRHNDVRE